MVSNPPDIVNTGETAEEDEGIESMIVPEGVEDPALPATVDPNCTQKPETGNRHIIGHFGRQQSHNEQLALRSCGVVVGHATFLGSETTPQTIVYIVCLIFMACRLPSSLLLIGLFEDTSIYPWFHVRHCHLR